MCARSSPRLQVLDAFVAHLKEEEEELVPKMLNNMSGGWAGGGVGGSTAWGRAG